MPAVVGLSLLQDWDFLASLGDVGVLSVSDELHAESSPWYWSSLTRLLRERLLRIPPSSRGRSLDTFFFGGLVPIRTTFNPSRLVPPSSPPTASLALTAASTSSNSTMAHSSLPSWAYRPLSLLRSAGRSFPGFRTLTEAMVPYVPNALSSSFISCSCWVAPPSVLPLSLVRAASSGHFCRSLSSSMRLGSDSLAKTGTADLRRTLRPSSFSSRICECFSA